MDADWKAVSQPGAAAYESSSDEYYDDDDGYADDPEITLASIEKSKTVNFSIRASYTDWKAREAFRELVQNWCVLPPSTSGRRPGEYPPSVPVSNVMVSIQARRHNQNF
jgi:hypothetical protein